MLDFVIFLLEKVQDIIVEQLTKFSKMIIHGGTSRAHKKYPTVVWDWEIYLLGKYFTLLY